MSSNKQPVLIRIQIRKGFTKDGRRKVRRSLPPLDLRTPSGKQLPY